MPNGSDMLIDGGPNEKVLSCLGKNMPFYDRKIDVIVLSHPQKDHLQGLISVLERYNVKYIVIGVVGNDSEGYRKLVGLIDKKKINYKNLFQGDFFQLGQVKLNILWPEKKWLAEKVNNFTTEMNNQQNAVLGISTDRELNDFSYYMHLQYGNFDALFTGDGDSVIQPEIITSAVLSDIELLKFPHHGSKTAILASFLDIIKPEVAVISSGKNPWGHPTKEALKILNDRMIKILRTDQSGDIEIISDGINWRVN